MPDDAIARREHALEQWAKDVREFDEKARERGGYLVVAYSAVIVDADNLVRDVLIGGNTADLGELEAALGHGLQMLQRRGGPSVSIITRLRPEPDTRGA